jgi:hypothetical protein
VMLAERTFQQAGLVLKVCGNGPVCGDQLDTISPERMLVS